MACKKDNSTPVKPPPTPTDQSFSTSFESMSELTTLGFEFKNFSDDTGDGWSIQSSTLGGSTAYDGTNFLYDSYAASAGFSGIISDWLISPKLYFQNGDKISFYTLSSGSNDGYADRLQLRLNTFNTSDSIADPSSAEASTAVGNFTTPLLDINALYKVSPPGDYPTTWTKYEATISGLNQPDSGRFALRYFVELNGGANGDEMGVDKLEFTSVNH
ncbi:MAG: choice-of-anchor J domain-containing protein [Parafilimonas sp.]